MGGRGGVFLSPLRSRHAGLDPASRGQGLGAWMPAFAGMTEGTDWLYGIVNCARVRVVQRWLFMRTMGADVCH